jgi:hypothetical protein
MDVLNVPRHCIRRHIVGKLDTVTAPMAKYRISDIRGKIIAHCLQLFGGYGYMEEYPISRMYRDARVMRIYAGTNEITKVLIARSLKERSHDRRIRLRPCSHPARPRQAGRRAARGHRA